MELNRVDPIFFYCRAYGIWKHLNLVGRVLQWWGHHFHHLPEYNHTPRVLVVLMLFWTAN